MTPKAKALEARVLSLLKSLQAFAYSGSAFMYPSGSVHEIGRLIEAIESEAEEVAEPVSDGQLRHWLLQLSQCETVDNAIIKLRKIVAARPPAPEEGKDAAQIAERLRPHGLALVRTTQGYDVIELGAALSQGDKP